MIAPDVSLATVQIQSFCWAPWDSRSVSFLKYLEGRSSNDKHDEECSQVVGLSLRKAHSMVKNRRAPALLGVDDYFAMCMELQEETNSPRAPYERSKRSLAEFANILSHSARV